MKNIIIIGAGPAGLTAADELIKKEKEPCNITILEKSGEIGLCLLKNFVKTEG